MAVAALIQNYYTHDETVKVLTVQVEEYLDDILLLDQESMDWGTIQPGDTGTWDYDVKNVGSVDCVVTREVLNLPVGWSEMWTGNGQTIIPGDTLQGTLTLTVPADAVLGTHTWSSQLVAEEVLVP